MSTADVKDKSQSLIIDPKKREVYEKLSNAIFSGSNKEVISIIGSGIDVSGPIDENGQNILHLTCYAGLLDLIVYFFSELAIDKRPHVNSRDYHGWTPLLCAASNGHVRVCQYLLQNGGDPKISNDQKTTPLHYLCRKREASLFIKEGASTAKNRAANRKEREELEIYFEVLSALIKAGLSVDCRNYMGETPLMQAASKGNEPAVVFLLENKADPRLTNLKGDTALFYATNAGQATVVKLLSKRKTDNRERLISNNVKLDHLSDVFLLMCNPDAGVHLSDKKNFFITYRSCFSGSELIDWILKNLAIRTREEALQYSQKFLDGNFIVGLNNKKKFKDSNSQLYRFSKDAPLEDSQSKQEDQITMESFQRINVLGRGAFGKVLLVRKKDNNRIFAMKIIEKSKVMDKPRDFKNLMSEKKILQNDCPFLVHLHYAFQTNTDFYLVMDFLGGGDLNFHLKSQKRFPEKIVQFVAGELVIAISYLHSRGIIYRDLKPQNILVDTDGHICLADFGLSKEVTGSEASLHTACGTPSYSAPEVLEGHPYSKSVDWWSFGICLYQFLVGKTPFHFDGDFAKLVNAVINEDIYYPEDCMSEKARSFLQGVLQKDPRSRLDEEEAIKKHPFFTGVDWSKLEVKKVSSPFKVSANVLENFDPKYTNLAVNDNKAKQPKADVDNFTFILH